MQIRLPYLEKLVLFILLNLGFSFILSAQTVMFESVNINNNFIVHQNGNGKIASNLLNVSNGQFKIVNGLSGSGKSLQSVNFPNSYLRHRNGVVFLETFINNNLFKNDATWDIVNGLSNSSAKSIRSKNFPSAHIRHRNGILYLENVGTTTLAKQDATFFQRPVETALVDVFQGADPEITNFDGTYRIYVTNQAGIVRCMRPNNNNNLRGGWFASTAVTLPSWFAHGWAPAVVKVGNEYRMYLSGRDTRQGDQQQVGQKGIHLFVSTNPNSGFSYVGRVISDNAGGCTDVIDAGIDGNLIYFGGSAGNGCYVADLTNNGRGSLNPRKVTQFNSASEFSEGPFVGSITGISGKIMLYARGFYLNNSYGTNWAKFENGIWVPKGRVGFPIADQYLFKLGHASIKNDWIAVNSNRGNGGIRRIAIGKIKVVNNGNNLQGSKSAYVNSKGESLEVSFEEYQDIDVLVDYGLIKDNDINIVQMPNRDKLYVGINATAEVNNVKINIIDMNGKLVKSDIQNKIEIGIQSFELDISGINIGIYLLKIESNGSTFGSPKKFLIK